MEVRIAVFYTSSGLTFEINYGAIISILYLLLLFHISLRFRPKKMSIRQLKRNYGLVVVALIGTHATLTFLDPPYKHSEQDGLTVLFIFFVHLLTITYANCVPRQEYSLRIFQEQPRSYWFLVTSCVLYFLLQLVTFIFYVAQGNDKDRTSLPKKLWISMALNAWIWIESLDFWKIYTAKKFVAVKTTEEWEVLVDESIIGSKGILPS